MLYGMIVGAIIFCAGAFVGALKVSGRKGFVYSAITTDR